MVDEVDVERCLLFLLLNIGSVKSMAESNVDTISTVFITPKQTRKKIENEKKIQN